jgi:tetratricopeptide (TPR) repeat protein
MQQMIDNILSAMNGGRHAEALRLSRVLAESFPADQGVRSLLAVSEQNGGDLLVAKRLLLDLTKEFPRTWQHWNNLGNVERLLGELDAAGEAYKNALGLNEGSARLRANVGLLHLNRGEFERAREQLCMACTMPGVEPGMLVWAAVACQANADDGTARRLIKDWQSWPRPSEEAMVELGWLLFLLGDQETAHSILAGEFQDLNFRARALARRALAFERMNQLDDAIELVGRMGEPDQIADRQTRMETLQALATIAARKKDHGAARRHYTAALALELPFRYSRPLYFGLAKACDQLDDPDAAMAALDLAHADDASATARNPEGTGLLALLDPRNVPVDSINWKTGDVRTPAFESPVFVVGFPRSGTTLLEQMLSAHPGFASVDEQPMVQRMLEYLRAQKLSYPGSLADLGEADLSSLREVYWKEACQSVERVDGVRLVDKHPLNFLALPLIRRVFPDAPMIFCQRHPCDSLLSSYMQDFRDPGLAAECSSLEGLARLYQRLVERWKHDVQLFPDDVLYCRYEDLVSDADLQLKRIGEFLGVDDVSAMRDFSSHARTRGFIGTPSYSQVVEGLSTDAAGRWLRYRKYLEPVLPTLAPIVEEWGYEL